MSAPAAAPDVLAERLAIARHVRRRTLITVGAANVAGAAVTALYLLVLSPGDPPEEFRLGEALALGVVYVAIALPVGDAISVRGNRGAVGTLEGGRPLDARQRAALVRAPARAATVSLALWVVAALVFSAYSVVRYELEAAEVLEIGLTIVLGGLTTAALAFLLNEGPMRAVYGIAFGEAPPTRAEGIGVRMRLVLSWTLGAGAPLLGIALAFVGVGAADFGSLRRAVLALVVTGLVAGSLITLRAARSVAEPLASLRTALDRVRRGDLDAQLPIDDLTEIGLLQVGFNEMVAGLRQRAELEDLFGRHVGAEVAAEALRRGIGLGGERREVSALFVDVVGSTSLAATRAPEDVVEILNAVFDAVVRVAGREGGWVNKFQGDAALCVFGAPLEQADHAARALRAACALRDELRRVAQRHPGLDAGIGVSSGAAVAGNVGAEDRYEYTVIGDPVNEAARLTEAAKARPGRLLASGESVRRATGEASAWREAAVLHLRGRPEPTTAYEPAAARRIT